MQLRNQFSVEELPILGQYNKQRFKQFSPEDCANWYLVPGEETKRKYAMYPAMGRKHVNYLGINQLLFSGESRGLFRSVKYWYNVVGNAIYRIDANFTIINISGSQVTTADGSVFFSYLTVGMITFACFVDGEHIYVYREDTGQFYTVTDPNAPSPPKYIATFGNRITVSQDESSTFVLSVVNLGGVNFDPTTCFTISMAQVFAQENGIIRQMAVLNNTLYIFTDFTTGVWANIPAIFSGTGVSFPWKKNTTYDWNFGLADDLSLDVNFGQMTFYARNSNGLRQIMTTTGDIPKKISSKAIDVLIQRYANASPYSSPFISGDTDGFMYQYEDTIFYRFSAGNYTGTGILDQELTANSLEFNFDAGTWSRCIELNGERNRIQRHVFFNNRHFVSIQGEGTIYEMSGSFYTNDVINSEEQDPQAPDAYTTYPMRYERITPIISQLDYSEFETEYVEIDFVFGDSNISYSDNPFANTQFIIDEQAASDGSPIYVIDEQAGADTQPVFMITEEGDQPSLSETTYNDLFKPTVELYWSDDGGISFHSASQRVFSDMGVYQWRMRWYQLGCSRNRVYKLIVVSPVPIVILGAVMNVRRVSGGSN